MSVGVSNRSRRGLGGDRAVLRGERASILRDARARVSSVTALMVVGDLLVAGLILVLSPLPWEQSARFLALVLVCRSVGRLYRPRLRLSYFDDVPRSVTAVGTALVLTLGVDVLLLGRDVGADELAVTVFAVLALGEAQRALVLTAARVARRFGRGERTLIVGADDVALELVQAMVRHPEFGLRPIGMLDVDQTADVTRRLPLERLKGELPDIVTGHQVTTIVLALPVGERSAVELAMIGAQLGCTVFTLPRLFEFYADGRDVERLRSFPLVRVCGDPTRRHSWRVKMALDRTVAAALLVLLLPLLTLLALLVHLDGGRPLIFSQERVGRGGRPFRLYKFRSLRPRDPDEAATTWSIDRDPRLTAVGRFLRKSSLDELPQIWNVLRGDMSLVGPRPERPVFVERFTAAHGYYASRHRVPSGLTGLAQVNGLRGDTSIADRARYDNYYIASWSLWLDLRILCLTVGELLRHARR